VMSTFNCLQSIPLGGKETTWAWIAAHVTAHVVAGAAGGYNNCWKPSLSASLVMPLTPSARLRYRFQNATRSAFTKSHSCLALSTS
jgi:hypothetical protein